MKTWTKAACEKPFLWRCWSAGEGPLFLASVVVIAFSCAFQPCVVPSAFYHGAYALQCIL